MICRAASFFVIFLYLWLRPLHPGTATVLNDLAYAARTLRRSPLLALVAIATIALGIGASTAILLSLKRCYYARCPTGRPIDWSSQRPR